MFLQAIHRVAVILLVLWTGGCANPMVADQPMRVTGQLDGPVRTTLKSRKHFGNFDQSLTKAEKTAVIRDLENAREQAQQGNLR
jgi:hypothetical protein